MLSTADNKELPGISQLLGSGIHNWKEVVLELAGPFYLVNMSLRESSSWLEQTILLGGEFDLACFCVDASQEPHRRVVSITQLSWCSGQEQPAWNLTKIAEVWEGEEYNPNDDPEERETGYTAIVLKGENGEPVGMERQSGNPVELHTRIFPY